MAVKNLKAKVQVGDTIHLLDAPLRSPDAGTVTQVTAHNVRVLFPIRCYRWIPISLLMWALGNRKYRGPGKWNTYSYRAHKKEPKGDEV